MKNDTFTLWGVQEPKSGQVLDTYATREIARNACGKRYKPVKLECRIVPQSPKKPRKSKTFTAHGLEWIPHTPGDPMPCDGEKKVRVFIRHEREYGYTAGRYKAKAIIWKKRPDFEWAEIIGWNYAP